MASIEIHRRPSSYGDDCVGSLFIRVIHRRKTRSITLPFRLYAGEWDARRRRIVMEAGGDLSDVARLHRLEWLREVAVCLEEEKRLLHCIAERLEIHGSFTVYGLTEAYHRQKAGANLSVFASVLCRKLAENGQERTARAYRSVVNRVLCVRGGKDILLKQITPAFLAELQKDILQQGRSLNTVSFYMRNLRAIYNKGIKEGLIESSGYNPFEEVYTGIRQTRKRALCREDICRLDELDLLCYEGKENEQLRTAQKLFLFSFFARGMSFVDMAYLRKEDIRDGRIVYTRRKTGTMLNVKVSPAMQKIIRHFEGETEFTPFVFPIIRHMDSSLRVQYENGLRLQNKRLKKLAVLCGIDKSLSTHVARHTWATMARRQNIPLSVISEGLGHSSEKTTSIYLASFEHAVIDRAADEVVRGIMKRAI